MVGQNIPEILLWIKNRKLVLSVEES
jgi:hypothetical protein